MSNYYMIGGKPVIKKIVDVLYDRILSDPVLMPYFSGANIIRIKSHQEILLSQIIDEPHIYDGPSLRYAHKHLNVTTEHFDRVVEHVVTVLEDEGLSYQILDKVVSALLDLKPQIVSEDN